MDLNQLKTFVAVAEEKHLTRAAERLFTSQPAVSAQLKALEQTLSIALFDRTPKGMELTPAGEKLLSYATQTLLLTQDMVTEAKALRGKIMGTLEIGVNSDLSFLRIPPLLNDLQQSHPDLKLSLVNSMSSDIVTAVRKGNMDTGFFFGPHSGVGLYSLQLANIETAIVAPSAWAERIENASINALAELPWIYTTKACPFYLLKETLFKSATQVPTNKTVFADTEENIRSLIKSETGVSLLRKDDAIQAEKEGWGISWSGATPPCPLSVAVLSSRTQEPAMQIWLQALSLSWDIQQPDENLEAI